MKIVYNHCFGGFGLSHEAVMRYAEIKNMRLYPENPKKFAEIVGPTYWLVPASERPALLEKDDWHSLSDEEKKEQNRLHHELTLTPREIDRGDPALVQTVEELGEAANSRHSDLAIADLPAGTKYIIDEYDGRERVMTPDDFNWQTA